jgi:hypothetical protein
LELLSPSLTEPYEVTELIDEVISVAIDSGVSPTSECLLVLECLRAFAGWRYRITRELVAGQIDCSTLVSQSHWSGAAVGVPFVAETQRLAYNARTITSSTWLPGDVLVRYPSSVDSPNRRHNHVALFAGSDRSGVEWAIESKAPLGVRAVSVTPDTTRGGVRRFLPNPHMAFPDQQYVLRLAKAVPKLGRLGARLTSRCLSLLRHQGVDIYFDRAVEVVSPLTGSVVFRRIGGSRPYHVASLADAGEGTFLILAPVEPQLPSGASVCAGDVIGTSLAITPYGCNVIPSLGHYARLHIECWSARPLPFDEERELQWPGPPALRAYNALYAMKANLLSLPVTLNDLKATLSFPLAPNASVTPKAEHC